MIRTTVKFRIFVTRILQFQSTLRYVKFQKKKSKIQQHVYLFRFIDNNYLNRVLNSFYTCTRVWQNKKSRSFRTFRRIFCALILCHWCTCLLCAWRVLLRSKLAVQSSHLKDFGLGDLIFSDFKPMAFQLEVNSLNGWAFFAFRNSSFQSCADIRKKTSIILDLGLQLHNFSH